MSWCWRAHLRPHMTKFCRLGFLFENLQMASLYLGVSSVMTLYANGRTSGLVVDSGRLVLELAFFPLCIVIICDFPLLSILYIVSPLSSSPRLWTNPVCACIRRTHAPQKHSKVYDGPYLVSGLADEEAQAVCGLRETLRDSCEEYVWFWVVWRCTLSFPFMFCLLFNIFPLFPFMILNLLM